MMSVVLGFGTFLLRDPRLPPERRVDVQDILTAAGRAAAVTAQLLAFSRNAVHRPAITDLGATARSAEPELRQMLGDSLGLELTVTRAPHALVDQAQLRQAMVDLVGNARDATPAGGRISVVVDETELTSNVPAAGGAVIPPGRYATFLVRDTGAGMDEATRARIFEPFFTTKSPGHGTGLALAAVHGIVTQNGGYITLESAPGRGASFTLHFPVVAAPPAAAVPAAPPAVARTVPQTAATVMVVDDEPSMRAIATRMLQNGGYKTIAVSNGADAIATIARDGTPHLVLTDLMMPGIPGTELGRLLRAQWPELPILYMSGYSADILGWKSSDGLDRVLIEKPFTAEALMASVSALLGRPGREDDAS